MFTFKPITLDANHGDEEAVLVMRSDRLVAVASRLGPHHDDASGNWFVEAVFSEDLHIAGQRYGSLDEIKASAART
jgi:hypothetical protein